MIHIRRMTAADIPLGMRLKEQAGWNQTEADWLRFLDLEPDGCFVAEWNGEPVATTTTCILGDVAWVAMVLVDARLRRHGIGTALMQQALRFLDERNVRSIRLDATPAGRPVYEKLGFVPDYQLARFDGILPERGLSVEAKPLEVQALEAMIALDGEVTGANRHKLLNFLFKATPELFLAVGGGNEFLGYVAMRAGSRAWQIGPCIAKPVAAAKLLTAACRRCCGQPGFIDIPMANQAATSLAESLGLTVQRQLLRMHRGAPVPERIEDLWASSGPEMG
ncbi:MAG: GNAT family N-acetyltransferase [Planctomycetota bacterium]|nr:MAG: GNAT family N-acetyltransferase [Planctomycetota bacterium]